MFEISGFTKRNNCTRELTSYSGVDSKEQFGFINTGRIPHSHLTVNKVPNRSAPNPTTTGNVDIFTTMGMQYYILSMWLVQ